MSSSIFSSEVLRSWWRRPAAEKRRALLGAALLVAIVPIAHGLAAAVDEALLPYSSLAPYVLAREALTESTEVVFAGSSHFLLGIRPDLFSFDAMSVVGPGWDYRTLEAAVRANLDRTPNLRLAVVELDLFPLRIDTPFVQRGRCRTLRVWGIGPEEVPCSDTDLDAGPFGAWAEILVPSPRLTPWAIWEIVKPRFVGPVEGRTPIAGHRRVEAVGDPERHGPRRVAWLRDRFGARYVEHNRAALERLVGLLVARGVEVVLLRMPHQESFTGSVPAAWSEQLDEVVAGLREASGRELPVWDYEDAPGFAPTDFMDSVHLNAAGVEKLAGLLERRIGELPASPY